MGAHTIMSDTGSRSAIITGGGRGIGRAITLRLLSSGWECLIVGLDYAELKETVELVNEAPYGNRLLAYQCDISTNSGRALIEQKSRELRFPLGLLVNCAAQCNGMPLFAQSEQVWIKELQTNLIAASLLAAWAIDQMRPLRRGAVVNIGSVYGFLGLNRKFYEGIYPQSGDGGPVRALAYHASKGALAALTRELAVVAGQWNIRVNTVSPGMIKTPEMQVATERANLLRTSTPIGRLGCADDVAAIVETLACDNASFVTGANWVVDGGWSIW